MPNIHIIAGCNGAGKTTASFTILPEDLKVKEFVNADSIAAGLSPFNVESVAIEAGRLMLQRIQQLMEAKEDFAFETTLSTRSYVPLIKKAKVKGYKITLLYFWLHSPEFAKQRVAKRVRRGGHNIPDEVVERRYHRGISNLLNLYIPIADNWKVIDNMVEPTIIAKGNNTILNSELWNIFLKQRNVMEDKNIYLDEDSEKLLAGLKRAFKKLVETSAKLDEELVILDIDGKVKSVPAKDLLHRVQE
ncbi:zeta toxin family protein [Niastella vici]|uniref:zeta toxin family protein n=1 Tax=Niastella vici TaxID=1703345 RepID=UPI0009BE4309|nr:zeta toxin family protein [Niastella vici]